MPSLATPDADSAAAGCETLGPVSPVEMSLAAAAFTWAVLGAVPVETLVAVSLVSAVALCNGT